KWIANIGQQYQNRLRALHTKTTGQRIADITDTLNRRFDFAPRLGSDFFGLGQRTRYGRGGYSSNAGNIFNRTHVLFSESVARKVQHRTWLSWMWLSNCNRLHLMYSTDTLVRPQNGAPATL